MEEYGSNLQNVEKSMRGIYHADPEYKLVQVDQSGAEALVVAYLCERGNFRELFLNNIKSHVYVALHVFSDVWEEKFPGITQLAKTARIDQIKFVPGWPELEKEIKASDNWLSERRYYFIGKKVCHASNYGMMGGTFQLALLKESGGAIALTRQQADRYLQAYHALFPEIRKWHFRVQDQIKKTKVLRNLFGYPFQFTGFVGESIWKEAYAFVPQSTVGTITNIAFTRLQEYIEDENKDWHLLANTHDSYLCECPDNDVKECSEKMKEFINMTLTAPDGTIFQMKSEAQVGDNWAPYKEGYNDGGLREVKF